MPSIDWAIGYGMVLATAPNDGTVDASPDLQRNIDQLPSGGRVVIPDGTYLLKTPLRLSANTWLQGAGKGTTVLKAHSAIAASMIRNANWTTGGETHITVSDMQLDGSAQTSGAGIEFRNVSKSVIENVVIDDAFNAGIYWWSGSIGGASNDYNRIENVHLDTCRQTGGTALGMSTLGKWHRGVVRNSYFTGAAAAGGLTMDTCTYNVVENSYAFSNVAFGFETEGASGVSNNNKFIGCYAYSNTLTGTTGHGFVLAQNAAYTELIGCHAFSNARHGIRLQGTTNCTISGCVSYNNSQNTGGNADGIVLVDETTGCLRNVIVGNHCYDDQGSPTQRTGINETQNGNRNIIANNIVLNNTSSQVVTVGAETVVTGANITA